MLNNLTSNTGANNVNVINKEVDELNKRVDKIDTEISDIKATTDTLDAKIDRVETESKTGNFNNVSTNNIAAKTANITTKVTTPYVDTNQLDAKNIMANNLTATENIYTGAVEADEITATNSIHTPDLYSTGQVTTGKLRTPCADINNATIGNLNVTCLNIPGVIKPDSLHTTKIDTSCISATNCVTTDKLKANHITSPKAYINCVQADYTYSTELETNKSIINAGLSGKGKIDTTGLVWKVVKTPIQSGILAYTGVDDSGIAKWSVTIVNGRQLNYEDEEQNHIKFFRAADGFIEVAVDKTDEIIYTYTNTDSEPLFTLDDNTGTAPADDKTYVLEGTKHGMVYISTNRDYAVDGLSVLGNLWVSNLDIGCSCSSEVGIFNQLFVGYCLSNMHADIPTCVDLTTECAVYKDNYYTCFITPYVCASDELRANKVCATDVIATHSHADCITYNQLEQGLCSTGCIGLSNGTKIGYNPNIKVVNNNIFTAPKICAEQVCTGCIIGDTHVFGDLSVVGDIYQKGTTYSTHAEDLYTCSDNLKLRDGATTAGPGSVEILKYDGTTTGVIELATDGILRIGDKGSCTPVMTRQEANSMNNGKLLYWDATTVGAKTTNVSADEFILCADCAKVYCESANVSCENAYTYKNLSNDYCNCSKSYCGLAKTYCDDAKISCYCAGTYQYNANVYKTCADKYCQCTAIYASSDYYTKTCACSLVATTKASEASSAANNANTYKNNANTYCQRAGTYATNANTYQTCANKYCQCSGISSSIAIACKNALPAMANCYGNSRNCVQVADIAKKLYSPKSVENHFFYTVLENNCSMIETASLQHNPATKVTCIWTQCVAQTLAVPNSNGSFRMGSYCIYIS